MDELARALKRVMPPHPAELDMPAVAARGRQMTRTRRAAVVALALGSAGAVVAGVLVVSPGVQDDALVPAVVPTTNAETPTPAPSPSPPPPPSPVGATPSTSSVQVAFSVLDLNRPASSSCTATAMTTRRVTGPPSVENALTALFRGPIGEEQVFSYTSALNPATDGLLRDVLVEGDTAYIDLQASLWRLLGVYGTSCGSQSFFAQVGQTLRPLGIRTFFFALDGDPRAFVTQMEADCPTVPRRALTCDAEPFRQSSKPLRVASQSSSAPARSTPLEVATRTIDERLSVIARSVQPEGTWVLSRLPESTLKKVPYSASGLHLEKYGELLLLDPTERRVLRSYGFPGHPPQSLLVTDEAVWCSRQGDQDLPESLLCRVDRSTLSPTVREFPTANTVKEQRATDPSWLRGSTVEPPLFSEVLQCGDAICVRGTAGQRKVDPDTLLPA